MQRYTCFPSLTTEKDVVDEIIKQDIKIKEIYFKYQEILLSI